jgi:hypothetical protein
MIVGDRALSDAEGAALLAEFVDSFGTTNKPVYFSREGWQILKPARVEAKVEPVKIESKEAEKPRGAR